MSVKRKDYYVLAFNDDHNVVDSRIVKAWTRREAHLSIMHKLKPHCTWDAYPVIYEKEGE